MNTYHFSGPPLCRPKMLADEWVETYLFRVARANGIHRPRLSDTERIRPTLPITASSKPHGYPIWSDVLLPRWSVVTRVNKIRYCPECMTESRYIRSRWRLTVFEVCTIHNIRLKDDLAEPVMTRGYKEGGRYFVTDVTDEQLWAGAVCPMPNERRHIEHLWSDFERSIIGNDVPNAVGTLPCILFLEALLDAVATTLDESRCLPTGVPRYVVMAKLIEQFEYRITPDLDGIRTFLDQLTVLKHRYVVLARLRRMLTDEADRPTCLSNLPVAELRMQLLNGGGKWPDAATRGFGHPRHTQSDGYVSFDKAESVIGCTTSFLRHIVRNKFFPDTNVVQHGRKRFTYLPLQAVQACRRWYASLATREQVMIELDIDHRTFATLVNAGLLRPLEIGVFTFFQRSDLTDLCRRLEDISRPFPVAGTYVHSLFGKWMSRGWPRKSTSLQLVKEAFDGKFPIFRQPGNSGFAAYFVDQTALDRAQQIKRIELAKLGRQPDPSHQLSLLP
ncbi:TniQ family protein [Paraburkholderia sediminicola]|uniref:TniQ family protein n=1 Tax=Paraburkholderia sediminicola TaxID=458836 RepID=UPI0038B8A7C4